MGIIKIGIAGLDEMLLGGIPDGHTVAIMGSPGTGKSTFVLQFIYTGLQNNENCVYISLEESEANLIKTALIYGLIEYITDGVIVLRQVRHADLGAVTTFIEVLKMRHIDHSKEIKPYSITNGGIVVHSG